MANPFDQFDPAPAPTASKGNPFDQFDTPAQPQPQTQTQPEGPGLVSRVMNAANKGLVDFASLPDTVLAPVNNLIDKGLSAVGMTPGGNLQDVARKGGLISNDPGMASQSKGEDYLQSIARAAGGNLVPALITGGLSSVPLLAGEVGGSVGQGAGGQAAKDLSGGSPLAQAGGEILGGLAGGLTAGGAAHALQGLLDRGATTSEIVDAANSLGSKVDPKEVQAAVDYRDAGGKGATVEHVAPADGVTVYHGGSADGPGEWFTTNKDYAQQYAARSNKPQVYEMTLPKDDPRVSSDYPEQGPDRGFTFNGTLTPEEIEQLRPVNQNIQANPFDQFDKGDVPAFDMDMAQAPTLTKKEAKATIEAGLAETPVQASSPDALKEDLNRLIVPDETPPAGPYSNDKMAVNVNSERLGTDDETRQYLGEATKSLNLDPVTHADQIAGAEKLLTEKSPLDVLAYDPRVSEAESHALATRAILRSSLDKMQEAAARVLDPAQDSTAAVEELNKYRYMSALASAKTSGDAAFAGRLLNARKIDGGAVKMAKAFQDFDNLDSKEFAQAVLANKDNPDLASVAKTSFEPNWKDHAVAWLNAPRTVMSSFDLSAPFRQGIGLVHKKEFWEGLPGMVKQFGSEEAFQANKAHIDSLPTRDLMDKAGLFLAGHGKQSEEAYLGAEKVAKIPVLGHIVEASERSYNGFLNRLRADTFNNLVEQGRAAGIDYDKDVKALKDLGNFINTSTGRGKIPLGKNGDAAAPALAAVLYSPRLISSRLQMLNPLYYMSLAPQARKEAIKSLLAVTGFATTAMGLGKAAGADVEIDPRSSDFGKIKIGNTRYDPGGGFLQYLRLGAELASGERKTSGGEIQKLGEKYGSPTQWDAISSFVRSKLAPVPGTAIDLVQGKDVTGQPVSPVSKITSLFTPMLLRDMYEVQQNDGTGQMAASALPAALGIGISSYQPTDQISRTLGVTKTHDPVVTEIQSLQEPGKKLLNVSSPRGLDTPLTDDQKKAFKADVGKKVYGKIQDMIKSKEWNSMSVEDKRDAIRTTVADETADAEDRL